ncbi:hypothetical protein DET55_114116 [Bacillus mycoides]|uniref:HNH endonuclease n=1 Tax=Bacillus mycoides TaxID=1405 RepID=A0A3D9UXI4_BACMY|nr:hypothetical protein DET63_1103 [Bacillus sp. DB-2]REF33283.1 hypothetical protein DET55_114116 [Bacillus mycoides]
MFPELRDSRNPSKWKVQQVEKALNNLLDEDERNIVERKFLTNERVCPYCDWYEIEIAGVSIDHFLPKSKFPLFSIYPKNLVMSCPTCNDRIKRHYIKLSIFHPYYDEVANYFKLLEIYIVISWSILEFIFGI